MSVLIIGKPYGVCMARPGSWIRPRMSGRMWEQYGKVRDRTGASRGGTRIEWVEALNPILRGWGNRFQGMRNHVEKTIGKPCAGTARTD